MNKLDQSIIDEKIKLVCGLYNHIMNSNGEVTTKLLVFMKIAIMDLNKLCNNITVNGHFVNYTNERASNEIYASIIESIYAHKECYLHIPYHDIYVIDKEFITDFKIEQLLNE